jgi:hypothetical protein
MFGLGGVTAIDTSVAADTVKVIDGDVTPLSAAVMALVPVAAEVVRPLVPVALLMVATDVVADTQVTWVLKFCVELSE